jgi:hypothetical protein
MRRCGCAASSRATRTESEPSCPAVKAASASIRSRLCFSKVPVPSDHKAWEGSLNNDPAEFGLTSVWNHSIYLANLSADSKVSRCPDRPLHFTHYTLVRRTQTELTLPNFTELNPVRAQLVTEAQAWAWSSAAAHCAVVQADRFLSTELWQNHWTNASWREYLAAGETETELARIRRCTHTGRPLGTQEFVHALEESTDRRLVPQKGGRPAKPRPDKRQSDLDFGP